MMPRSVAEVREHAVGVLAAAHVPSPEADVEILLGYVLGIGRGQVQARAATGAALATDDVLAVLELVERRAAREPLQHITGRAPFRSLDLAVGPGVFVPRPETEVTAQLAIDALFAVPRDAPVAVDLGTGSGALALALATEVPHAIVTAVENSPRAFVWARQNAREVGAANLKLVLSDLAVALPDLDGAVDVVVSNPPDIPTGATPRDPEVRLHDPESALFGGPTGLEIIAAVSSTALRLLRPGGTVVIEHGELQGDAVRTLLAEAGWRAPATHRDLLGRDRVTTAVR